jgi:hypothetical protein
MAHRRRHQSAEVRFGPVLKALLICLFLGGVGVGYVYQKSLLNELGKKKKEREYRLEQLRRQNAQLAWVLAEKRDPRALEQRARELGLKLVRAAPGQVVVLPGAPSTAGVPTLGGGPGGTGTLSHPAPAEVP